MRRKILEAIFRPAFHAGETSARSASVTQVRVAKSHCRTHTRADARILLTLETIASLRPRAIALYSLLFEETQRSLSSLQSARGRERLFLSGIERGDGVYQLRLSPGADQAVNFQSMS